MVRQKIIVYLEGQAHLYYYEVIIPELEDIASPTQYRIYGATNSVVIDSTGKVVEGRMSYRGAQLLLATILYNEYVAFARMKDKRKGGTGVPLGERRKSE